MSDKPIPERWRPYFDKIASRALAAEARIRELEKAAEGAVEAWLAPPMQEPFLRPRMEALRATLAHKERP
jgi:hypothetical protein